MSAERNSGPAIKSVICFTRFFLNSSFILIMTLHVSKTKSTILALMEVGFSSAS